MSKNSYNTCRKAVAAAVGMAVGISVALGNLLIPLAAVLIGIVILYLCRRRVKEELSDERNRQIGGKAARFTIAILGPVMAVLGTILLTLSRSGSLQYEQAGLTLAYTACVLVVLYDVLYYYFEKMS